MARARANARTRAREHRNRKSVITAVLAIIGIIIVGGGIYLWQVGGDPVQKAKADVRRHRFERAVELLGEAEKADGPILATRMALLVGLVGADAQMQQELQNIENKTRGILEDSKALEEGKAVSFNRLYKNRQLLEKLAGEFRRQYVSGEAISTPWDDGVLPFRINVRALESALQSLDNGNISEKYLNTLTSSLQTIGVFQVLQTLLGGTEQAVPLNGTYKTATLLYYIGARVENSELKTWYMEEVAKLTTEDEEVGRLARQFLKQ